MQTFTTAGLSITAVKGSADAICYVLYPFGGLGEWIEEAAEKFGVSVAVITGMDWDDDLTPWPAKGQPPGSPDFRGNASRFLPKLITEAVPETERRLGLSANVERTLAGVSLSGLFTLWQWMTDDFFRNIICLSGSFWYAGMVDWIKSRPVPRKAGRAYFLLGNLEARTKVKAFQPVQTDTEEIVGYLRRGGIDAMLELVPGNHYQYGEARLTRAFTRMFTPTSRLSDAPATGESYPMP